VVFFLFVFFFVFVALQQRGSVMSSLDHVSTWEVSSGIEGLAAGQGRRKKKERKKTFPTHKINKTISQKENDQQNNKNNNNNNHAFPSIT